LSSRPDCSTARAVRETLWNSRRRAWRQTAAKLLLASPSAEKDLTPALEIACEENDRQLQGLATAGPAKNLMYQGEYVKAIARFEEALVIFEELAAAFYAATVRGELGTCCLHLGETTKALELLEGSAETFLTNGSVSNYQVSLADIGSVYLARGEYVTAISYYRRALELARQLGDQLSISKWLRNLYQAYSLLGNPTLAQGFASEAEQLNIALSEERKRAAQVAASLK
jgi:tetratricopeptide (TPR) repeat protein